MTSHFLFPHMKYQPDGLDAVPHSSPRHSKMTIRSIPQQRECLYESRNANKACRSALPMQSGHPQQPALPPKQTKISMSPSNSYTVHRASIQKVTLHEDWDNRTETTSATITTCDSSASSSLASWCETASFVPKQKELWYGEPLVRVRHRFDDVEFQQLRHENDVLRWQCRVLQQQQQKNS